MSEACQVAQAEASATDPVPAVQESARVIRFRRRVDVVRHTAALWLRNGAPLPLRPVAPAEPGQGDAGERASFLGRLDAAVQAAGASRDRFAVVVARVVVAPGEGQAPTGAVPWDALSQRLRAYLRHTDVMARLRSTEFALLLKDADCAERAAAAIRALCEDEPLQDGQGGHWRVCAATGSSAFPADGADAIGLLRRAGESAGVAHWPRPVAPAPAAEPAAAPDEAAEPTAAPDAVAARTAAQAVVPLPQQRSGTGAELDRLLARAGMQRRVVHAGEVIYRAGTPFRDVHVLHVGLCKLMMLSSNGHEELGSLLFKGDWLGLDGLDLGVHRYTALAIDTGELWSVRYDALMQLASSEPGLLKAMHSAMVRQSSRDRDAVLMQHVLPADGKVADFLARWAENLERSGLRGDQLVLPVTRAEIGAHLGLRLESVSRAVSRLEREGLISFGPRNRREIQIPRLHALREFVSRSEREA